MKKPTLITPAVLREWPLPQPSGKLGKEDRGRVLVVGGSEQIPGAVLLAAVGALRAGAGTLQVATAQNVSAAVAIAVPEARVIGLTKNRKGELARGCSRAIHDEAATADAVLVGPGMVDSAAGAEVLALCMRRGDATVIVDAAPIMALRNRRRDAGGAVVITPHAGEMARLCEIDREEVLARPLAIARETAARLHLVVALKGATTFIVAPDGRAYANTAGNVGLGTSGSGDTLSGIIAGLAARGAEPLQAAAWGVYLHARAGDALAQRMGPLGFLAREILDEVPGLLKSLALREPAHS